MIPYPYQQDGISFLAGRTRAALLDEPGLGKTGQAIEALNVIGAKRVLIVVPLIVAGNWERELGMWAPWRTVHRLRKGSDRLDPACSIVICPESLLASKPMLATLTAVRWDVCIVDEAHHFKSAKAKRTVALYGKAGVAVRSERLWILTGTLMPNNPSELWTHLLHLHPRAISDANGRPMSEWAFTARYCTYEETRYGKRMTGAKNTKELREILAACSLRRLQRDVLADLPHYRQATVALPAPPKEQLAELTALLDRMSDELGYDVRGLDGEALLAAMQNSDSFSTYRRLCGELKTEGAIAWVAGELEGGVDKIVVFAIHRGVIAELETGLEAAGYGAASIHGGVGTDTRDDIVRRFQTDPRLRVLVCQITSGGVGITLTAACRAVFVETDWVPGNNLQASKRIHRIGQERPCIAHYLYTEGSIDEHITQALERKSRMIAAVGV